MFSFLLFPHLQIAHTLAAVVPSLFHPSFMALFPIQEAAQMESQLLPVPEHKMLGEVSIFIPNLVSWWAHKLLPAKIATLAKKCLQSA